MLLWLTIACAGDLAQEDPPSPIPSGGWIDAVLSDPAAFTAAIEPDRPGWIALHANDLHGAVAAGGEPARRAQEALATLSHALDRLAGQAWEARGARWGAQTGIPAGSALPVVTAISALDHGDEARAAAWLAQYTGESLAPLVAELQSGGLTAATAQTPLGACIQAHLQTRQGQGDLSACPRPLVTEGHRALHDPLVYRTQAIQHERESSPSTTAPLYFSGQWSHEASAHLPASWAGPTADEPAGIRDRIRSLDASLDGWHRARMGADLPGQALVQELKLVAVYRSHALTHYASRLLEADLARSAQAAAQLSLDAGQGRAVGPLNPPLLFVVLAEASLRQGRSREALDMLDALRSGYPSVSGLLETIGDLAVLDGMTRQGDSKEN